jgi:hypothetical protein
VGGDSTHPAGAHPVALKHRSLPAQLRYLSRLLHEGDHARLPVAVALEALAAEIDAATVTR